MNGCSLKTVNVPLQIPQAEKIECLGTYPEAVHQVTEYSTIMIGISSTRSGPMTHKDEW